MELEDAKAASRTENSIRAKERDSAAHNSTKGAEKQKQEGSRSKRTSHKMKSKRWDGKGDENTYKKMVTEVRVRPQRIWSGTAQRSKFGMSSKKLLKKSQNHYKSTELDEGTLRAMIRTVVGEGSLGDD